MDLTTDRRPLLAACDAAAAGVAAKTTIPALKCLKLEADAGGTLTVTATDAELTVRVRVAGCRVAAAGAVLLPADRLVSWLKEAPDAPATLAADGAVVRLRCGRGRADFPRHDLGPFPDRADDFEPVAGCELPAEALLCHVRRVRWAAGVDDRQYVLGGVYLWRGADRLTLAAADGKRFSVSGRAAAATDRTGSCVLPGKALGVLSGLAADPADPVAVSVGRSLASFTTGRWDLTTRLIEGRFPPPNRYLGLVGGQCKGSVDLPAAALLAAVRQVSILAADGESRRAAFGFEPGVLTIVAGDAGGGTAGETELELPGFAGDPVTFRWDPDYLGQFLKAAVSDGQETVRLEYGDPEKPVLFRAGPDWTYLLAALAKTEGE